MSSAGPGAAAGNRAQTGEIVSLAERMGYLQALRVVFAVVLILSSIFASDVIGASLNDVMFFTASYLLLSATAEALRRAGRGRGLTVIWGMLLVDGIFLAWASYVTGGSESPLRFLVYVHLIAVTLAAAGRTGLKIAVWHALLFFVAFFAQTAGWVREVEAGATEGQIDSSAAFFLLAILGVAVATKLFSDVNERELRKRKSEAEALTGLADALEDANTPRDVATTLLDRVSQGFAFERGIVLAAPSGGIPTVMAYRGPGDLNEPKPNVDALVKEAWESHRPVLRKVPDPDENPQITTALPMVRNVIVFPMFAGGQAQGALVVEHPSKSGTQVSRRVAEAIQQFAAHAALALRNSWLHQQVQQLADTDALTGISNRRTFEANLERELSRASRSGEEVTLMMVDIDHFKSINDTHGHQVGDEVLKRVAAALSQACREFDMPARYGGEEFAVILPNCSSKESLLVSERLRTSISAADMPVPVTASAGVATYPVHASEGDRLIAAADEALYESKRAGRDRVTRSRRKAAARKPVRA